MGKLWTTLSHLYSLAGPTVTLLYPLHASVQAMESSSKLDDEQWLAYWILYSFITLMEMVLHSLICWIPIWYELKLLFTAWLVLPNFRGAVFIYNKFVREHVKKHNVIRAASDPGNVSNNARPDEDKIISTSPKGKKTKRRLLSMVIPKKLRF
ncbi:hypothetical protein GQ55_8G161700 [Panicum hallii var. hallii]|uniref:HVA22-like protein n=1 Tax=Panicum hallii var. hallii TaxID=1504633 RepID=A0A2T7CNJ6_9POAL|nr:hypothetical protein GQ55_8G161700 [Panicum hallii var. hallii]